MVRVKNVYRIDNRHITNKGVKTEDLDDAAVNTAKIADAEVKPADVNAQVIQFGRDAIDSVESAVSFPTAFPGVPGVVAVGVDVVDVKVTNRASDSFGWVAASAGSGVWIAIYRG